MCAYNVTIDLDAQTVTAPSGATHHFDIDPFRKQMLLTGRDEIALTLGYERAIAAFEARHAAETPWLTVQSATSARIPCWGPAPVDPGR